jgi:hypothetical protein
VAPGGGVLIPLDDGTPSYAQRVAEMCAKLAMSPPSYVITQHGELMSMYSGYARFENSPEVVGKVGEFSNVYSKKKAKECCAEQVLKFLQDIANMRAGRRLSDGKVPDGEDEGSLLD